MDVSASQKMVAVVDDANELHVYDLATRKVLWTAEGATSAAWNTHFDDMLCYSGNGFLCTKTADFAVHRQKFQVRGHCLPLCELASTLVKSVCNLLHNRKVTRNRNYGSCYVMQGFVVGFSGSKAYCLHSLAMQTLDVPLAATLQSFVNLGAFETAYQACPYWASYGHSGLKTKYPYFNYATGLMQISDCTAIIDTTLI